MQDAPLDPADQRTLFDLARRSIRAHLEAAPAPALPRGRATLEAVRGVFVTLHRGDELRGCIGHAVARLPLAEAVLTLAVSAARDRRFEPVVLEELEALTVELSVLSPLAPVRFEQVDPTRHGLVVRLGGRAGLLLPQVAQERGWDARTFVEHTCRKAGLPPDAWRDPAAELEAFTCALYVDLPRPVA
jgi:AmmeMemoRadiSam system protein A